MKEYRLIMKFKYKGKKYNFYLDNNNQSFYTGTDDNGKEHYITIEEYIELLLLNTKDDDIRYQEEKENIEEFEKDDYQIEYIEEEYNNEKSKIKKMIPKIIYNGKEIVLTAIFLAEIIMLNIGYRDYNYNDKRINLRNNLINQIHISAYKYKELDVSKDFEIDTYIDAREEEKRLYIYDMDYIGMALPEEAPGLEGFIKVINENNNLNDKYKEVVIEYCKRLFEKYPNVEKRQFYHNLKTLKIEEETREKMSKDLNAEVAGYYSVCTNEIKIEENSNLEEGTYNFRTIFHELSHCLRLSRFTTDDGIEVRIQFDGPNYNDIISEEALNSLFALSLLNDSEQKIGYQKFANYHKTMVDTMDNYDLSDYINHSLTYYANKLNEYNKTDEAIEILARMNLQYINESKKLYNIEEEEYYPIIDYIAYMYLKPKYNGYQDDAILEAEIINVNKKLSKNVRLGDYVFKRIVETANEIMYENETKQIRR